MASHDLPLDDPWAGLNHKEVMSSRMAFLPPWVPEDSKRRLTAYRVLSAYQSNNSRVHLPAGADNETDQDSWQEYGDAALITRRIADAVVGEAPNVAVLGADAPLSDGPEKRPAPQPPDTTGMDPRVAAFHERSYTAELDLWENRANAEFDRWAAAVEEQPALIRRQDELRDWAEAESFLALMVEAETRYVVPLGEVVYTLGFDDDAARPTVESHDPNSYYPVLEDARPSQYPNRVHLAWGIDEYDADGSLKQYVRRITYELVPVEDAPDDDWPRAGYLDTPADQRYVCLLSDGTWEAEAFRSRKLNHIDQAAEWRTVMVDGQEVELDQYPLGYDFMPVVHVTHDLAGAQHYGQSPIAVLAQLLDELQATDTDESLASRRAARPIMAISGMSQASGTTEAERRENNMIRVPPGAAIKLKEPGGRVSVVDMAQNLVAIGERVRALLKRLSVAASVTEGMIGRVDASEVPSGLALTLSFTAFEQMIEGARLARAAKYRLLLKMVQRIQIHHAGGWGDDLNTEVYPAEVAFGAFMPQDFAGTVELVGRAIAAYSMSIETGVQLLQEAGSGVEDVAAEVAAIRAAMGDVAEAMTNATGDPAVGAAWLGLSEAADPEAQEEPPATPAGTLVGAGVEGGQ